MDRRFLSQIFSHPLKIADIGFDVLTAVVMKSSAFWDITPYSPLEVNRLFVLTRRLHLFLFGLFLDPEHGGDTFLQNAVKFQGTIRRYVPGDRTQ
jgi:hypothetical protein